MALRIIIILLFISVTMFGQSYKTVNKVVNLKQEHSFYINSKTRIGGKTRNSIKIDLPENTIQWFYVFTTTTNETEENHTEKNIQLGSQLTSLLVNGAVSSNAIGLSAKAAYQIIKPTGVGIIDVYLTDYNGFNQFNQKDALGLWSYSKPATFTEGSRENAQDGTVVIDDVKSGTVYLCFKNPSPTEGVLVTLEVAAVVAVREYVDIWTTENRQNFTNNCLKNVIKNNTAAQQVCNCLTNKIVSNYTPSSYNSLTQNQQSQVFQAGLNRCYEETGNTQLRDDKKRILELEREIVGLSAMKDYDNLILKYEEVISLGYENDHIYNTLAWYAILTQKFDKSKEYLTKGLGINPSNLLLQGNLAHYFLLTGDYRSAEEIYLRYKKKKVSKKVKWKDAIKDDFELFESLGMYKPEMDKIKKHLKIKK